MGLLDAIGAGIAEAGGAAAKMGMAQMQSAIEEQRAMRLAELQSQIKLRDEQTIRDRNESERAAKNTAYEGLINKSLGDKSQELYGERVNPADMPEEEKAGFLSPAEKRALQVRAGLISQKDANDADYQDERNRITDERNSKQDEVANRREDRMMSFQEAQLQHMKAVESRAGTAAQLAAEKEMRAATSKALDGVNADIRSLEKDAANPMLEPAQKAVIDKQLSDLRREGARYRSALDSVGIQKKGDSKDDKTNLFPPKNQPGSGSNGVISQPSVKKEEPAPNGKTERAGANNITVDDEKNTKAAREAMRQRKEDERTKENLERIKRNRQLTDKELAEWNRIMGGK